MCDHFTLERVKSYRMSISRRSGVCLYTDNASVFLNSKSNMMAGAE